VYGIIYKAVGPGGKVYIGQTTKTLAIRKGQHKFRAKKQDRRYPFGIALLDEGFDAFAWEAIDQADTPEDLDQKEKAWIAHYDSMNPERGYNGTDGGHNASLSEEARRKLSEAKSGEKHPFFGKNLSSEHRQKIGEAQKGKVIPAETRRKISLVKMGHEVTEEARRKLSEAHKGKSPTAETLRRMSEAQKGRRHTEETRLKIREALVGHTVSAEARNKMSEAKKGRFTGENGPGAKLTKTEVIQIKIALARGERAAYLAKLYNISLPAIKCIRAGKTWKDVSSPIDVSAGLGDG
jgi:group I intron endonuclease